MTKRKKNQFGQVPLDLWQDPTLGSRASCVLVYLALDLCARDHVRQVGLETLAPGECCPSYAWIAQYTGLSERTVQTCIHNLEENQHITVTKMTNEDGTFAFHRYTLPHRVASIGGKPVAKSANGTSGKKPRGPVAKFASKEDSLLKEGRRGANAPASGPSLAPAMIKALQEEYDKPTAARITCLIGESAPVAALQINGGTFSDLSDQTQRKVEAYVASGESGMVVLSSIKALDEAGKIDGFTEITRFIDVSKLKAAA